VNLEYLSDFFLFVVSPGYFGCHGEPLVDFFIELVWEERLQDLTEICSVSLFWIIQWRDIQGSLQFGSLFSYSTVFWHLHGEILRGF
jgi:hypothetical protein